MQVEHIDGRTLDYEGTFDEMVKIGSEQMRKGARSMKIFRVPVSSKKKKKLNKISRESRRVNRK